MASYKVIPSSPLHKMTTAPTPPTIRTTPPSPYTTGPPSPNDSAHGAETPRGRLKRRRLSSHSPPRDPSPSRGHDRASGSRYRQHYRKHQRASSSPFVGTPPSTATKKNRRRSDAEPDHTLRGRVRRSRSPVEEGEEQEQRKRSIPPSRDRDGRKGVGEDENAVRRLRSYPNMYKLGSEQDLMQEKGVESAGAVR